MVGVTGHVMVIRIAVGEADGESEVEVTTIRSRAKKYT
jgi:hypothetical protein